MWESESFTPRRTADGSFTFFSNRFGEPFHSYRGARQYADLKFVQPAILPSMVHQPPLRLLDIGYGLGYNTATALEWIWSINPYCQVELVALEVDAAVLQATIAHNLLSYWNPPIQQSLTTLATQHHVQTEHFKAALFLGDARQTIQQLQPHYFDAIFLDPFSPACCPQLWTVDFLRQVSQCLTPQGRLATHSSATAIRSALTSVGLHIGSTQLLGQATPATIASFTKTALPPLTRPEQNYLQTRAAIPYRDPDLSDTTVTILQRRKAEQKHTFLKK